MTSFGDIVFSAGGIVLRVYALLLIAVQLYVAADVFLRRCGRTARLWAVAQLLTGLCWFCLLLDGSYYADWVQTPRVYPAPVTLLYASPWLAVAAVELVLTVLLLLSIRSLLGYRRRHLSRAVIKETLDMLPVGICFAKEDGTVVLSNLQMDRLCTVLTGRSLVDDRTFRETIEASGEAQNKTRIVPLPDGGAVMFLREEITVNGGTYHQTVAFDVSRQYRILAQLKSKNKKLIDLQTRIKAYSAMVKQLAMTEEILHARVKVHDEMGYLLLSGKHYLEHPNTADAENLLKLERYTHQLLMREGEEPDDAKRDGYIQALQIARAIGVQVTAEGEPPPNDAVRDILGRAIRECAANTVKHAAGDRLRVTLTQSDGRVCAVIGGNGNAPEAPVSETGGLMNLRRSVERAGGEMQIACDPCVTVTLRLPLKARQEPKNRFPLIQNDDSRMRTI